MSLFGWYEMRQDLKQVLLGIADIQNTMQTHRSQTSYEFQRVREEMSAFRKATALELQDLRGGMWDLAQETELLRLEMAEMQQAMYAMATQSAVLTQAVNALQQTVQPLPETVAEIQRVVRQVRFMVSPPSSIDLVPVGELEMAKVTKIQFAAQLPPPPASEKDWREIASGKLEVGLDGEVIVIETTKDQQLTADLLVNDDRFLVLQDTDVPVTFSYIDDAGNIGASVSGVIKITDTIPPVTPESIGLVALAEVEVDVPDPEPEPEPEPTPEPTPEPEPEVPPAE